MIRAEEKIDPLGDRKTQFMKDAQIRSALPRFVAGNPLKNASLQS